MLLAAFRIAHGVLVFLTHLRLLALVLGPPIVGLTAVIALPTLSALVFILLGGVLLHKLLGGLSGLKLGSLLGLRLLILVVPDTLLLMVLPIPVTLLLLILAIPFSLLLLLLSIPVLGGLGQTTGGKSANRQCDKSELFHSQPPFDTEG